MTSIRTPIVLATALLLAAPLAFAGTSPFSSWMQLHVDSDWTSLTHNVEGAGGGRFVTNMLCLGDAASNKAGAGDVSAYAIDTVGPHLATGPSSGSFKVVNTGGQPECPTIGAGVMTFTLSGRYEDRAPNNVVTVFGSYTVTGTGSYATVTGGGSYSLSFTGTVDADSGWPSLLDGSFVGGTHF